MVGQELRYRMRVGAWAAMALAMLLVAAGQERQAAAGPAAAIIVVDPASDTDTEMAMTMQATLQSAGYEIRATRNLDKTAGVGASGQPRWQEPAEVYLREIGVPAEIGGDAGRYARYLGAKALVRLQATRATAPVIRYAPAAAASAALAMRIQQALPGASVAACAECTIGAAFAEVVLDMGADAALAATQLAGARALVAGFQGLTATGGRGAAGGQMISPAPGSTLPGTMVRFAWTAGTGATNYWLMVGTWLGGNTLYSEDRGTLTGADVNGLPLDGRMIYVRLWTLAGGVWQSTDSTYRAYSSSGLVPAKAQLTVPAGGFKLGGSPATLEWTAGVGVSRYYLMIGLWPGGNTIYDGDQGENRKVSVTDLPVDGRTLYVRLWSYMDGVWQFQDSTAEAAGIFLAAKASLIAPFAGSKLEDTTATFEWNAGAGVERYYLFVGTWPGGDNLYNQDLGTELSASVSDLPSNGSLIYVRLWSYLSGKWEHSDAMYMASGTVPVPVKAAMLWPVPNTTWESGTVQFNWSSGTEVRRYYLFVGTSVGNNDIVASDQGLNLSTTLTGLPVNGKTLYVRLWSYTDSGWLYNDYQYRAAGR